MNVAQIAVIGAGAVGLYYGGRLAQAGNRASFLARSGYDALKRDGLTVESWEGDFQIASKELSVFKSPTEMPPADVVIVALKATASESYLDLVKPVVKSDGLVICLQNGFGNEEIFAEAFGNDRVAGAIAYTCINRIADNHVSHTAHGKIRIGNFARPADDRIREIAAMMAASKIPVEVVDDLHFYRWDKLVWNIPFNGLGALLNLHTRALLATPSGEKLVRRMMATVIRAANACGAAIQLESIEQQLGRTLEMGPYHSSMQLDRQNRLPMEIEVIIGEPLRRAREAGADQLDDLERLYEGLLAIEGAQRTAT